MLRLFQLGAEVPSHRKLLTQEGVADVGLSFVGLSRRVKFTKPWLISEKLTPETNVLLDSGGYSIRTDPDRYSAEELEDLGTKYLGFVESNLDRVELITDFDAPFFDGLRNRLTEMAGEKYLPIWHQDEGLPALELLADMWGRVGVPQTSVSGRDIKGTLNKLAKQGVKLHGVAMTKTDLMSSVAWDSVASTSWLSPAQFGDSQIWTGHELKRYPKAYKEQGRKRHRQYLKTHGFDTELYESDNVTEVLRVALWSWKQLVDHINRRKGSVLGMSAESEESTNSEFATETVGTELQGTRTTIPTTDEPEEPAKLMLPGFKLKQIKRLELGKDGEQIEKIDNHIDISGNSLRQCDSCYISEKCPESRPGASCAYGIPIMLNTPEAKAAADDVVDTIRFQRIAFGHIVEQLEGGYPDPNLSREIDAWDRSRAKKRSEDSETFSMTVKASSKAGAQAGFVARMFGRDPNQPALPVPSDHVLEQLDIVDGEVTDG